LIRGATLDSRFRGNDEIPSEALMTTPQAILIGAAIIACSVIAANGLHSAQANTGGPYQLMHHSNTSANAGVFRLDTTSGGVSYCYINAGQAATCTGEVK
jgi:hypothetical protein